MKLLFRIYQKYDNWNDLLDYSVSISKNNTISGKKFSGYIYWFSQNIRLTGLLYFRLLFWKIPKTMNFVKLYNLIKNQYNIFKEKYCYI